MTKYKDERWIANGSGILLRRGRTSRPGDPPGDPLVPEGYELLKEFDLTVDEGWYKYTGHTISRAYYLPSNILFGPTGMRIRYANEAAGDSMWSSGQAAWGNGLGGQPNGFVPGDAFYIRFVAKMEQAPILGDFPCFLWQRKIGGSGKGEIDHYEMMANHIPGVGTATSFKSNKVTMIETPYVDGNINYSKEYNYAALYPGLTTAQAKYQMSQDAHVFETYKYPTRMEQYVDGVLHTTHVRGGTGDNGVMTNALWDANFDDGGLFDLRVCVQYGDWTTAMGAPANHTGNAGAAQTFAGSRYLNLSELVVAVPA